MNLSKHFTLEEMTFSQSALNHNVSNEPDKVIIDRLMKTAAFMENVRTICGDKPIFVTSGYRNIKVNALVGGAKTSAHMSGYAVDFRVAGMTVNEVCEKLESNIAYDQLINEYGRWTHISFDPRFRRQYFSIK